MSQPANAASKYRQSDDTLLAIAGRALGAPVTSFSARELAGGMCNAVYLLDCDGRRLVVKLAPPPQTVMMRHERDILRTEADMLRLFGERLSIPTPRLIRYDDSRTLCPVDYFVMSFLPGRSLLTLSPRPSSDAIDRIKRRVGEICRDISSLAAPTFGVPALRETHCASNADFVRRLFELLLQDLADAGMELPSLSPQALLARLDAVRPQLDEASAPVHVHTDTWDGNLMIENDRLVGLVDHAAILWGDPLMNHDFHDFAPEPLPAFLQGFGFRRAFTPAERVRLSVYALWQRLGMIVERGYRHYDDPGQYAWVVGTFTDELANLDRLTAAR